MAGTTRPTPEERRDFFRIKFNTPLEFKAYSAEEIARKNQVSGKGLSQNISQSGILFQIEKNPPQLSSLVWMNLDIRTLRICQEIERRALIFNNGLLGRVVRVEEDQTGEAYDVGVCFLTKAQKDSREVKQILSEISQSA